MKRNILTAQANVKQAQLSAIVTVGEITAKQLGVPVGTQIDYGVVAYYTKNRRRMWLWRIRCFLGRTKGVEPWHK
jgi:hypothetical protein